MKKHVKGDFKLIFILTIFVLMFSSVANAGLDYKPPPQEPIEIVNPVEVELTSEPFSILIWNIGYCGLGEEADFFMDGGKMSIGESKETVERHFEGVKKFLKSQNADIYLLQEVDLDARRSYGLNQVEGLRKLFPDYSSGFAYNYKVPFVPAPLKKPMGRVQSGLLNLSRFRIMKQKRYTLPGNYGWPTRVFHLDRCILVSRYYISHGLGRGVSLGTKSELVIINMHLSAFDKGGEIRKQQLKFLREFIMDEYRQGNYVIVGGDWNHSFPGFENTFANGNPDPDWLQYLPEDWAPEGWRFVYDKTKPTIRANSTPYTKGKNFRTIIDGFLVSPGIKVERVEGFDLEFKNSDHNPVMLKASIEIPVCKTMKDIELYDGRPVVLEGIYRVSNEPKSENVRGKVFRGTYIQLEDGTQVIKSYSKPNEDQLKLDGKKVEIQGIIYSGIPPEDFDKQRLVAPHIVIHIR